MQTASEASLTTQQPTQVNVPWNASASRRLVAMFRSASQRGCAAATPPQARLAKLDQVPVMPALGDLGLCQVRAGSSGRSWNVFGHALLAAPLDRGRNTHGLAVLGHRAPCDIDTIALEKLDDLVV